MSKVDLTKLRAFAQAAKSGRYICEISPDVVLSLIEELEAANRVIDAARAVYDNDDFITEMSDDKQERDQELGNALAALDSLRNGGAK